MNKVNVAVIGCGYWGPNLVRNFNNIPDFEMKLCCDLDHNKLKRVESICRNIELTSDINDVLNDKSIDAVAIATPVYTHKEVAKQCLQHNKHVFIEKPMASSSKECLELIALAEQKNKTLMVGHTFEYTAAVNKIKEIIDSGELGELYYINCVRANLGLFQPDINVIWDLAPHDLSILMYILGDAPISVNAQGQGHLRKDIAEVATLSISFPNHIMAFLHESWLHPDKVRRTTIVGSKKMLVYDDISQNEKIRIFDKGVEAPPYYDSYAAFHFSYRYGDILIPKINDYEPLREECEHFLDCIRTGNAPSSDGYSGLRVVKVMEAADESIANHGAKVNIDIENLFPKKQEMMQNAVSANL